MHAVVRGVVSTASSNAAGKPWLRSRNRARNLKFGRDTYS
jgi:hypothetical protein